MDTEERNGDNRHTGHRGCMALGHQNVPRRRPCPLYTSLQLNLRGLREKLVPILASNDLLLNSDNCTENVEEKRMFCGEERGLDEGEEARVEADGGELENPR